MHIKKGDNIIVIAGKHKGAKGKVAKIAGERVFIDGVNKVKHHIRAKSASEKGSIVEVEASVHHSNVKLAESRPKAGQPRAERAKKAA